MKKIIVMFMSVLMLTVALCGCGGAGSPEDAVENFVNAAIEVDLKAMIECMPPQISENFLAAVEDGKFDLSGKEREFRNQLPDDVKCEIKDKEKIGWEEIEEFEDRLERDAEELADIVGSDSDCKIEIEEAYYVKYDLIDGEDIDGEKLEVGKIDGRWYVLTADFDDAF